ncbi:type IV pilus assembly protein PilA [Litorivivens lipolytica]|uniref:Type IV pilus assembly protein PilA n=1 Tax=Litorivivens lipolytica TaxID=1524264 RepID=A0A7W4Z5L3_9GAMM|nr:pilin [Litorivivens lipolytica]MBB3047614.1 type IV pilus assembly protein PilA [Litorivivens lipolytica]
MYDQKVAKSPSYISPSGFTLVELLSVVAIIGILASIAIPAVGGMSTRSKMSELILAASACKNDIVDIVHVNHGGNSDVSSSLLNGCDIAPTRYVASGSVDANGVITIVGNHSTLGIGTSATSNSIQFTPLVEGAPLNGSTDGGKSINKWRCGPASVNPVDDSYLPGSCRS